MALSRLFDIPNIPDADLHAENIRAEIAQKNAQTALLDEIADQVRMAAVPAYSGPSQKKTLAKKDTSFRDQNAGKLMRGIAEQSTSTEDFRTGLRVRNIPLTAHHRKAGVKSWAEVGDASLRSMKRRILAGQFPRL
jgi:hypothetical protein